MNYYIDQGNQINEKLNEGIKILEEELRKQIETIKEELIKTNDSTAESHIEKCQNMENKIQEELIVKINNEIKIVTENAEKWQGWFDSLKAIEGDNGYDFAKSNGFYTKEETIKTPRKSGNILVDWGNQLTNAVMDNPVSRWIEGDEKVKKSKNVSDILTYETKTIYYWTSYSSVSIDGNGYISININFYTKEDNGATTSTGGFTATVASDADYTTYYTNRSSVGKR